MIPSLLLPIVLKRAVKVKQNMNIFSAKIYRKDARYYIPFLRGILILKEKEEVRHDGE